MDLGTPVIARNIAGNTAIIQHRATGMLYETPQVNNRSFAFYLFVCLFVCLFRFVLSSFRGNMLNKADVN